MKKADLVKRIATLAKENNVEWVRTGGSKHDKYELDGAVIMIPRHNEIGEMLAKKILKDCDRAIEK